MVAPTTIARVFSEVSFSNASTRITSSAVALSAEYIRLFVREAILRANAQRLEEAAPTEVDGIDNVTAAAAPPADYGDGSDASDDEGVALPVPTQLPPATDSSDTLTTRHLAAVSGLLVVDF
ncbi:hypothetical protein METBIDRAFT_46243 [Metschnikowia bicuspidata var. bicuspidata NRRL YB-4993]|uniref:Histone H2A/H2B/H3 domain-containing protein n=1 Tax=Metschnikowia bicuspidata var. bicuspidata NRRL YB-4993 TaxID=869754 RepID=A0A1A0H6C4_9ASCO|nr:hypothetical protein METBIDRAFT_46243 [Metschnikowia bicuspidata var. bicuspidata NRRL YB-4993]OBA19639.1 hypothetical protein METBIDRAFT_46243 [Metschnikowia bicuspidata var. bicuspidata NRRL YB-4993]